MAGVSWSIDGSEVERLVVDLTGAPGRMQRAAPKALRRGGKIIEAAMKEDASGHRYLRQFPSTVSSGMVGPLTVEIGFENRGQGRLAHIILFGSVNNAPVYRFMAAPNRAMPAVLREFGDEAEGAVLGVER